MIRRVFISVSLHVFADSNKGKSKKWRKILQFPHITQCIGIRTKIGMEWTRVTRINLFIYLFMGV